MTTRFTCLAVAMIFAFAARVVVGQDDPLTNEDVVTLTDADLGGAVIVAKIKGSATDFDTSVDALVALSKAGVGDTETSHRSSGPHEDGHVPWLRMRSMGNQPAEGTMPAPPALRSSPTTDSCSG